MLYRNQTASKTNCKSFFCCLKGLNYFKLFAGSYKEKEKVKPNSLIKLLSALVRQTILQSKEESSQFFAPNDNLFSFLNSKFVRFIEQMTTDFKLSLITNKSQDKDSYKNLSRSIDLRKSMESSQDFGHFAAQSTAFDNFKFLTEDVQKRENVHQPPNQSTLFNISLLSPCLFSYSLLFR